MDSTFIHVDEAIATAMTLLPMDNSLDKAIARQWAYMALRDIGPGDHWYAECLLYPDSQLKLKKPTDMWKAIDIALYSGHGEVRFSYKGMGTRIHNRRESNDCGNGVIDLSEDTYSFNLGSNSRIDGVQRITHAHLKYWKLPIDTDGMPLIPESQLQAIALYIRWWWSIRQNANQSDRQLAKADYMAARSEARSQSKLPNGIAFEQIAKEWTSLLNAPQFKRF